MRHKYVNWMEADHKLSNEYESNIISLNVCGFVTLFDTAAA